MLQLIDTHKLTIKQQFDNYVWLCENLKSIDLIYSHLSLHQKMNLHLLQYPSWDSMKLFCK